MRKFFVKEENIFENQIQIFGDDVNHIKNVLRLKIGDKIQICNSETAQNYICQITDLSKDMIQTKIIEKIESNIESNIELHIFQGLPKADKMELIIQKGTELGVSKFIPVSFKRSIVKLSGKDEEKKILRWQKIAEVASKQSGRDIIPEVENVCNIRTICQRLPEYDIILVAYEEETENYVKKELQKLKNIKSNLKIAVVIGPEGGIEKNEIDELKTAGCKVVTLGKRILRTETVTLMISSIIMYELEDEGGK